MKKLLIWGTGKCTKKFIENGYNGEIIGFVETNKLMDSYMGKPVYDSRKMPSQYDYIIVASSYVTEIYNLVKKMNLDCSKIIFLYAPKQRVGCIDDNVIKEILAEKNFTNYCGEFGLIEGSFIEDDIKTYTEMNQRSDFVINEKYLWPFIGEKYALAGTVGNYFWQDLWAARLVVQSGVKQHFDIGSRLDGFIAHLLASGIEVTMIDIRKFPEKVDGLHTIVDDATSLSQIPNNSIESFSALCSLEHFGLGRYGDPIDPEACFKCFENIQRKLKPGGKLYISLPVGKERLEFNAHRVFYPSTVIDCFSSLTLEEFSCTSDGKIEYGVDIHKYDNDLHNGNYRYGMFYFTKA